MKKVLKTIFIFIGLIILVYTVFVTYEYYRINGNYSSIKPLIVIKTDIKPYKTIYYGLGYQVSYEYSLKEYDDLDSPTSFVSKGEFTLFNTFKLSTWN